MSRVHPDGQLYSPELSYLVAGNLNLSVPVYDGFVQVGVLGSNMREFGSLDLSISKRSVMIKRGEKALLQVKDYESEATSEFVWREPVENLVLHRTDDDHWDIQGGDDGIESKIGLAHFTNTIGSFGSRKQFRLGLRHDR